MRAPSPSLCSCCSPPATTCASRCGAGHARDTPHHRNLLQQLEQLESMNTLFQWCSSSRVRRESLLNSALRPLLLLPAAGRLGAGQHCRRLAAVPQHGAAGWRAATPAGAAGRPAEGVHAAQRYLDPVQLLPRQAPSRLLSGEPWCRSQQCSYPLQNPAAHVPGARSLVQLLASSQPLRHPHILPARPPACSLLRA